MNNFMGKFCLKHKNIMTISRKISEVVVNGRNMSIRFIDLSAIAGAIAVALAMARTYILIIM